jgi:hypothetical protein
MHTSTTVSKLATVLGFFHSDLLNSLHIANPITKGINDLDILYIRDSVPSIVEMFHVVMEVFIMLLLDGLQGFSFRRMFVCTLKVFDEHGI